MQTGWPMPFANTGLAAPNNFTNSAGIFDWTSGTATTTLSGRYVRIVRHLRRHQRQLGHGRHPPGRHATTSTTARPRAAASAGNTPASRSGFYELNKLAEHGARLAAHATPGSTHQLTANMNINQTCNALLERRRTVNFYRSGGGCRNTGELAGGVRPRVGPRHGRQRRRRRASATPARATPTSRPSTACEDSCVGHGFFQTLDDGCGQTADGTGFNTNEDQTARRALRHRLLGRARRRLRASTPDNTPDTALGFVCSPARPAPAPAAARSTARRAPVRQAAWDLVARDLTAAPFSFDSQTAFIVGNRSSTRAAATSAPGTPAPAAAPPAGCATTNGYMQWITADDDNGNLNDGTPHMTAIFNAFNRHGIACATPTR